MLHLDVEIHAEPGEMRDAISHLGDRERAALHGISQSIDLRDKAVARAIDLRTGS